MPDYLQDRPAATQICLLVTWASIAQWIGSSPVSADPCCLLCSWAPVGGSSRATAWLQSARLLPQRFPLVHTCSCQPSCCRVAWLGTSHGSCWASTACPCLSASDASSLALVPSLGP